MLFNLQNLWCRRTEAVIKTLNQLCANFLWMGKNVAAKGERVGWSVVCRPKAEGGLVRELELHHAATVDSSYSSRFFLNSMDKGLCA